MTSLLRRIGALTVVILLTLGLAPAAFAAPTPSPTPTAPATPRAITDPVFDDRNSTLTIPDVAGVQYSVDGQQVQPGTIRYTVPFKGLKVVVTAVGVNGTPTPSPSSWTHTFPEVVEPVAPTFDDAAARVQAPSRSGVRYMLDDGSNPPRQLTPGSWNDLSAYRGATVRVYAEPVAASVTLLIGTTEWTHTFPAALQPPTFDDLKATVTIPAVVGVEYLIDGVVTQPGEVNIGPVAFRGKVVTVTGRGANGAAYPAPQTWKHTFPEVVEPAAPVFDDANAKVQTPSRLGVQYVLDDGTAEGKVLIAGSWNDLSAYRGTTVRIFARAPYPSVTLLIGTTEWTHTFPAALEAPTFDDLKSTVTIPAVVGVEYLIDGVVTQPGENYVGPVEFRGKAVTVTARGADGAAYPAPQTWQHTFPEVVEPAAPIFDNANLKVQAPSRLGLRYYVNDQALIPGSWNDMSAYQGQTITVEARAASSVTLLTGTTRWSYTFGYRPDYPITSGDEFNDKGVAKTWKILNENVPSKGKGVNRSDNVTVRDGMLDIRISRHCLATDTEVPSDANKFEGVCPPGTITRYSTGRMNSGFVYGVPKSMEVRAKLDEQHDGLTATAWMHNSQPYCNSTIRNSNLAEFDVMELWATDYITAMTHMVCTNGANHSQGVRMDADLPGTWNTYRVEWDGYAVRYFFNGQQVGGADGVITAARMGLTQQQFVSAINDYQWQVVFGITVPVNGGWAPWVDDGKPFPDRHDLFDYVRYETFDPAACTPYGAIGELARTRPDLGQQTGCETNAAVPGARVQTFQNGRVYWSPDTGANVVKGAILEAYDAAGGDKALGLPLQSEMAVRGGASQRFQNVTMFWSPGTGAHWMRGRILDKYAEMGWENSNIGFPTTDEICGIRDGGCFQRFQGENGHIYWSPATDAHFVRGAIFGRYGAMGWETGSFGYPISDEICGIRDGGCFQRFQGENGHIYWSPASGAWGVQGLIFDHYGRAGWETGRFGYPVGPEECRNLPDARECTQTFQGGRIVWNSRYGLSG
ncbi:hypothetical protein CGZ94_15155 [Enemella evansiae]|uniref:GH16 domain-containing protein n=1 Tax=Enemella evansiae TaxID=2016499 RepID=A0A255GBG1_9ACTN|nr:family 16 glycosylhydrolase [Enemella evansiae]OYO11746.1 hypothetical protein CGZ94_15155 [Enemella evansiae]